MINNTMIMKLERQPERIVVRRLVRLKREEREWRISLGGFGVYDYIGSIASSSQRQTALDGEWDELRLSIL